VSVRAFGVWNLINVLLGAGLILYGIARGGVQSTLADLAAFALMLAAGAVIVYSFWLMLATIAFWFVRIDNILVVFQSMYEAGRWPVAIYPPALRLLLTFIVPVAFAVTVPSEALVGRASPLTQGGALLLAALLFVAARLFWKTGIRHYSGASA
jgi:ABC-2 type transport system permease protein